MGQRCMRFSVYMLRREFHLCVYISVNGRRRQKGEGERKRNTRVDQEMSKRVN